MRTKLLTFGLAVLTIVTVAALPVSAHVFIRDESKTTGAILHIAPDDDPIAGEKSSLYYDVQDKKLDAKNYNYTLAVENEVGELDTVPVTAIGSTANAAYTFPTRGLFTLHLAIKARNSSQNTVVFTFTQRVSRGAGTSEASNNYEWARAGLVVMACAALVLAIYAFNNRFGIVAYSKLRK